MICDEANNEDIICCGLSKIENEPTKTGIDIDIDLPGGLQRKRSRSTKMKQKSFWDSMVTRLLESQWFQSIELRAAQVFNFMRGLSLNNMFPISPFTQTQEEEEENKATFGSIFDLHPTSVKKLYVVDSGLTFNSPYPVVLRPQREVDIILSFDFSGRPTDDTPPFKELLLAAKWAELNKVPFPPIDPDIVEKEGLKECYIFKHPWDPNCPIVLHFPLINVNFRHEVEPGVPRTTQEEIDFGNFSLFDDPQKPYSTFKFTYTHTEFDRISKLMEYNTLLYQETIFDMISVCIKRRRKFSIRRPCASKDIARLSLKSRVKIEKLQEYIALAEKVASEAEEEDKRTRQLRKQAKVERPVSSPITIKDEFQEEDSDAESVKNNKLQRSTVSLRPNMIRGRGMKPALSDVKENTEDKEDEETDKVETETRRRPITRSKPLTERPTTFQDLKSLSPFSTIEEEAAQINMGRRSSCDDSDVDYRFQLRDHSPRDMRRMRLTHSTLTNQQSDNNGSPERHHINGNVISEAGYGRSTKASDEDFVDAASLQEWINTSEKVTDL